MREPVNAREFLEKNKRSFFEVASTRKRKKQPRSKPRTQAEYLAIGQAVVQNIERAKAEGRFRYEPGKGITLRWNG